jgi:ELWxxDGT repeat protein
MMNYKLNFITTLFFLALVPNLINAQTVSTVKNINVALSSEPLFITPYNNKLYFFAEDDTHGNELWQSDGTEIGTTLAMDHIPGATGLASVYRMRKALNKLFFSYTDTLGVEKFMVTNGTFPNTHTISNFTLGGDFIEHNGFIYFIETENLFSNIESRLMRSDGTVAGTTLVTTIFTNHSTLPNLIDGEFILFNNKIYFTIESFNGDRELMYYDPINNNTPYVDYSSNYIFNMRTLTVFKNKLYCVSDAKNTNLGDEIYKIDTNSAVTLTADRNPGAGHCSANNFFEHADHLFFTASNGASGIQQHWLNDLNPSGTMWPAFNTTGANAYPSNHIVYKGDMYFTALTDTSLSLFKYNTTTNLMSWVKNISKAVGRADYWVTNPFVYNDKLYFMAAKNGQSNGGFGYTPFRQLWESDGTTSGTEEIVLTPVPDQYSCLLARQIIPYKGSVYFNANYNGFGYELNRFSTNPLQITAQIATNKFEVYPNPFTTNFTVQNLPGTNCSAKLVNQVGQVVHAQKLNIGATTVHLHHIISGFYVLQIIDQYGTTLTTYKIAKQDY